MKIELNLLDAYVDAYPDKMGGVPCLRGTRFPVAQLIAELVASGDALGYLIDDFDLPRSVVCGFMQSLADGLNKPVEGI